MHRFVDRIALEYEVQCDGPFARPGLDAGYAHQPLDAAIESLEQRHLQRLGIPMCDGDGKARA